MKKIVFESDVSLASFAADMVQKQIESKPDSILGLATGSTPLGLYKELAERNLDFSKITAFNLDEYYPIQKTDDQSYAYFMKENLFKHINIRPEHCFIPNGAAKDADAECKRYDELLEAYGGVDLQILGLGENGHIGFNEPDEELVAGTHKTSLTQSTIQANARFFESADQVPTAALTMGMKTIFSAKKIIVLVTGKKKHDIVHRLFEKGITTDNPASLLQLHPDVTVLVDTAAEEG